MITIENIGPIAQIFFNRDFDARIKLKKEISEYLALCEKFATTLKAKPQYQHGYSEFLLKDFLVEGSKDLKNIRYELFSSGKVRPTSIQNISISGFTKNPDTYTVEVNDSPYEESLTYGSYDRHRAEKLFGVIEGNAAPMLKFRQKFSSYDTSRILNPYEYPFAEEDKDHFKSKNRSKKFLGSKEKRRIVLAVFFAMQYLRSEFIFQKFSNLEKRDVYCKSLNMPLFKGTSFGDFILHLLPRVSENFFHRSWRWIYSDYDIIVPEATQVVPFGKVGSTPEEIDIIANEILEKNIAEESILLMPIGSKSFIFLLPNNSFLKTHGHDAVLYSKSIALNHLVLGALTLMMVIDMTGFEEKNGKVISSYSCRSTADFSGRLLSNVEEMGEIQKIEISFSDDEIQRAFFFLNPIPYLYNNYPSSKNLFCDFIDAPWIFNLSQSITDGINHSVLQSKTFSLNCMQNNINNIFCFSSDCLDYINPNRTKVISSNIDFSIILKPSIKIKNSR